MNENTNNCSWHMAVTSILLFCLFFLVSCGMPSSETMTPARFQEIVNTPPDALPLPKPLASLPVWPNTLISNVMTDASGKVFQEEMQGTARTVGGKYVVCAVESKYYQQTMYGILAYDEKTSVIKAYGLFGNGRGGSRVTEGSMVHNVAKRTYTITSAYDDFKETTTGSYTESEDVSKTLVYKSGAFFMRREATTRKTTK